MRVRQRLSQRTMTRTERVHIVAALQMRYGYITPEATDSVLRDLEELIGEIRDADSILIRERKKHGA
jgi:hypothetical protein